MNDGAAIVSIMALMACLVLAVRGFRSRRMGFERTAALAIAWMVIIAALAFVLQRYAA